MGILHKNTATGAGVSNPAASAETVIYTTPPILSGTPQQNPVGIEGTVNITPGTSTTGVVIRVRQGGLTGPQVGAAPTHTVAAGAPQSISFGATDSTGYIQQAGGGAYVVTAAQTAGTVAGTTNMVDIAVIE